MTVEINYCKYFDGAIAKLKELLCMYVRMYGMRNTSRRLELVIKEREHCFVRELNRKYK